MEVYQLKKENNALQEKLKDLKLEKRRLILLGKKTDSVDKDIENLEKKIKISKSAV